MVFIINSIALQRCLLIGGYWADNRQTARQAIKRLGNPKNIFVRRSINLKDSGYFMLKTFSFELNSSDTLQWITVILFGLQSKYRSNSFFVDWEITVIEAHRFSGSQYQRNQNTQRLRPLNFSRVTQSKMVNTVRSASRR